MKMKISIKTLKGSSFQIDVEPADTVANVKKAIETVHGSHVYPATQQMLIYQGKVLKDEITLEEQNVAENSFLVIMLTKNKATGGSSTTSGSIATTIQPATTVSQASPPVSENSAPSTNEAVPLPAPAPTPAPVAPAPPASADISTADVYGQAASNLVAGNTLESTIQDLLDMGGGSWTRDMVVRALRAAYNNPTRAVDYLYSGIPESAEVPPPVSQPPASGQAVIPPPGQAPQAPTVPSSGPNSNPLDLFPQGLPTVGANANAGNLDFLRNSQQFQALRAMVQANPQILQPMLQELGKHNPQLMRLIQEHQADFLRLINEPVEGEAGNILGQLGEGMPQAVTITPEEREAMGRLEAMGFDPALVLQVFIACNRNEELAANYLLDHSHEFDE